MNELLELNYLSDEELNNLIAETENDLILAPPELEKEILESIQSRKIVEFKRFRRQVASSIAAGVAALLLLPIFLPKISGTSEQNRYVPSKEAYMASRDIVTKEEALEQGPDHWLGGLFHETEEKE